MSRLSFILATTLLVVAGSLTFMMTFDRDTKASQTVENSPSRISSHQRPTKSQRTSEQGQMGSSRTRNLSLSLPKSVTSHLDQDQVKQVESILSRTRRDARETLNRYSDRYRLTKEQRRERFPLIVAHHEQAHPDMIVNGQSLPSIAPGSSLEESVSSLLNPSQQDAFIEDAVDDEAWWEDVVGQLENDLDTAINNGEIVPADEVSADLPLANESADGGSQTSEHPGSNLFNLLGR